MATVNRKGLIYEMSIIAMVTSFTYVAISNIVGIVLIVMKWNHQLYHLCKCCRNLFMCYDKYKI